MKEAIRGLALVGLCLLATAQTPATIKVGTLWCGAIKRSTTSVQFYAYQGSAVVDNALRTVHVGGRTIYSFNLDGDIVTWAVTVSETGQMTYAVVGNGANIKIGTL